MPAGDVSFAGDPLADPEARDLTAQLDDRADKLMPDGERNRDGFLCPGVPVVNMDVRPADGSFPGPDQHIIRPDPGLWDGGQCESGTSGFETLFDESDAVISDSLNHASLIDGIRLCKAQRLRYPNRDLNALEDLLQKTARARHRLVVTDGIFSMDGLEADLGGICTLAKRYDALVMVDDSHAVGFWGPGGRGTAEKQGVEGQVHILTGTLGKALGGASGGYTASSQPIVEWLRQRSRPYLFSNSLAPVIAATSLAALSLIREDAKPRARLLENARRFRDGLTTLGFELIPGTHPIIPILLQDAPRTQKMASALLEAGVYAVGFSYPVVPQGQARIRTQVSAAHEPADLDRALEAFEQAGRKTGIL